MNKTLFFVSLVALCAGSLLSCGTSARNGGTARALPDTLKINTTELSYEVRGFNGTTPVEIDVVDGRITGIKALPNRETPRFFERVTQSGLLDKLNGKTLEEAKSIQLDAVSGATYSSNAVIENVRLGLTYYKEHK